MAIEIQNYIAQPPGKVHVGTFDLYLQGFDLIIFECRHNQKGNNNWIDFPNKFSKALDGTWNKPKPYVAFKDDAKTKKLKEITLIEVLKVASAKPKEANYESNNLPF